MRFDLTQFAVVAGRWRLLGCVLALLLAASTAHAQVLQGRWVDEAEAAIEQHRKTGLTVIVLDQEDRAVRGAQVRIEQQRHDFALGLSIPADREPPQSMRTLPVYRCINAVDLDRLTDWSAPPIESAEQAELFAQAWIAAIDPVATRFGTVVSADPARNSDKLSLLEPTDLDDAIVARIEQAVSHRPPADQFDIYADLLRQDLVERKLGPGMIHRMFELARARRPDAELHVRFHDCFEMQRVRELSVVVQRLEVRQVPFDGITIEQRFTGQVQAVPLARMLTDRVEPLPTPVTLASVEVGGASEVSAALNMETVLRLMFAQPRINGIYLAGLAEGDLVEPYAALLDADGEPTAAGLALDALFHDHWHTSDQIKTDERGNASARVFTGWYTVTATLPDGTTISTQAYVPRADHNKIVVLQATAADQ